MDQRCLTMPALLAATRERKWDGKTFSVTQLLRSPLENYLSIKEDYAVNPLNSIASLMGTAGHAVLEGNLPHNYMSEFRLTDGKVTGQFDCFSLQDSELIDYKFLSSYKVAKCLGKYSKWMYDGVYQRGTKKGEPKYVQKFIDGGVKDIYHYALQLNKYKQLFKLNGIDVKKITLQVFVREGLTAQAKDRGLTSAAYQINIPIISEHRVVYYFDKKYEELMYYLTNNIIPPKCKPRDTWGGRKCSQYCSVSSVCPYFAGKEEK